MPANLTPQYLKAEERFKQAKTDPEKLLALEEMLATIPKHKGTEKLQADIKHRISRLKIESLKKKGAHHRESDFFAVKEGAGQIVILGPPNTGKSQLLASLTSAHPEIAPYPYTTQKILPGMMPFENIQIQLVDTPAISAERFETELSSLIRNADAIVLVVDISSPDITRQIELVLSRLESVHIRLVDLPPANLDEGFAYKKTLLIANKADLDSGQESLDSLKKEWGSKFPIIAVSAIHGTNLEQLKQTIFELLNVIRVYTKTPGKEPDLNDPVILKRNSKLLDAAFEIHKDFAHKLKYARVWGKGKYSGQMIGKDDVLSDGDIVEFHA
ncbi:MAG: hypothetical protein A2Z27_02875 [candidate division Zixibacteria bacterium RBG_16_50_21]|nr:MAG: hypothetical protein A2Z27_02875 [candidate division Zixibacteria bacterium RBG_16_50_21]